VLASDQDDDATFSLSFSSAGDIVELVIFSIDEVFLQTLRDAMGGSRRLWHVPSADKVGDLLVAGQVGILVVDVQALTEPASGFVTRIKQQFPELVIVVAGHREAESALANLISGGTVYRFIHKPVSPGRAKLFIDAAVRKYAEHHRPAAPAPAARPFLKRSMLLAVAVTGIAAMAVGIWALREKSSPAPEPPESARMTAPTPLTGLSEAQERLLAHVENALLEDRLDEAASSIDAARKAGVDGNRIAYLTAQLNKSRDQLKAAAAKAKQKAELRAADAAATPTPAHVAGQGQGQGQGQPGAPAGDAQVTALLNLAAERIKEGRLIEPNADSAELYVKQALQIDSNGNGTQAAKQTLAIALLAEVHAAIDRKEFGRAGSLLDAADGIVAPANLQSNRQLLAVAHSQADAGTRDQLLKSALERLRQDRLVEPANDSAKDYLMTLRGMDPNYIGLAPAIQDLGLRLLNRARHAADLRQYDAARSALDDAAAVGYASADANTLRGELDAASNQQRFLTDVIDAKQLTVVKSVNPLYPLKAKASSTEGWVELDFTVGVNGGVSDVAIHADAPPGIFDQAAISALSQWRFQPVQRDGKPAAQRARMRIRFALAG